MTAPSSAGTFRGDWRLRTASGQVFGDPFWVQVRVGGSGTPDPRTPTPTPTPGPDNGIELCDGENYGGACKVYTEGRYGDLGEWADRFESMRFLGDYVGRYHVVMHSERDFQGDPGHAENDQSRLGNAQRNHVRSLNIYYIGGNGSGIELCDGENYGGPCKTYTVGDSGRAEINDLGEWADRFESMRFLGDYAGNYHVVMHSERDRSGDPGHADNDQPRLGNAQRNHVRSLTIYRQQRNGIELCDGENYGGPCNLYTVGESGRAEINDLGEWNDRFESMRFVGNYAGEYHVVMHSERDRTGDPGHADEDWPRLGNAQRNHVRSLTIYKHRPPGPPSDPVPASGSALPLGQTSVDLGFQAGGNDAQVHVWGPAGYDRYREWSTSAAWRLDGLAAGEYRWQARARNRHGEGEWSTEWTFTITRPNQAPTAAAGPDQTVTDTDGSGDEPVTLDGGGSTDPEGESLAYAWTEGGISSGTGVTPVVTLGVGVHTLTLTVTDTGRLIAVDTVQVSVLARPNRAPVARAGVDQTLVDTNYSGNEPATLDGSASSDPDSGDGIASYVWKEGTASLGTSARLTTTALALGVHTITLTVTDGPGLIGTDTVVVTVNSGPNRSPVARAGADQMVPDAGCDGSQAVNLDGSASSDPDRDTLTFAWLNGTTPLASGAKPTVTLPGGSHTLTLRVTDANSNHATDTVVVVVNGCPVANAGPDQSVTDADGDGSQAVTLDGRGSTDPEGGALTYAWAIGTTPLATVARPSIVLAVGSHTLTLTVADAPGLTGTDTVVVTVLPPANRPPVARAGTDQTLVDTNYSGNEPVTLDGSGSNDPDAGDIVASYLWKEGAVTLGTAARLTTTLAVGVHTITLTVADRAGLTAIDTVVVTVNRGANRAPIARAGPDQSVTDADGDGSQAVTLDGRGSTDPEGGALTYAWTEGGVPHGAGPQLVVTLAVGTHTLILTVTDPPGLTGTDTVVITVNRPVVEPCPSPAPLGSYCVEYYGNTTLAGSPLARGVDTAPLSHVWESGGPPEITLTEYFSARWVGRFDFPASGSYRLFGQTDDGIRILVDGVEVVRLWDYTSRIESFAVDNYLTAGRHTVVVEYYELNGWASIAFDWQAPLTAPILQSPLDDASFLIDNPPALAWGAVDGAAKYRVNLRREDEPDSPGLRDSGWVYDTRWTPTLLEAGHRYEWKVAAYSDDGIRHSPGSEPRWFTIEAEVDPTLALDKVSSKFNGPVVATLTGFAPNSAVTLRWPQLFPVDANSAPSTDLLATGTTDAQGRVTLRFRTPLQPFVQSGYRVTARDADGNVATATLRVIPRTMLNRTSGPTDTRLRVYCYGFAPGERLEVRWHATGVNTSPYEIVKPPLIVASTGRASSIIPIPPTTTVGPHLVVCKVIGVGRSASETFTVTSIVRAAAESTATPTLTPTATATPTGTPTPSPTGTPEPTVPPTEIPTETPAPTDVPTETPTEVPTEVPTETPTLTTTPTEIPTEVPTETPTPTPEATSDEEETG